MPCACGEELLIDHEIKAKKCLVCMMLEFQEEMERDEKEEAVSPRLGRWAVPGED